MPQTLSSLPTSKPYSWISPLRHRLNLWIEMLLKHGVGLRLGLGVRWNHTWRWEERLSMGQVNAGTRVRAEGQEGVSKRVHELIWKPLPKWFSWEQCYIQRKAGKLEFWFLFMLSPNLKKNSRFCAKIFRCRVGEPELFLVYVERVEPIAVIY